MTTTHPFLEVERYLHADIIDHTLLAQRLNTTRTQIYRWRNYGVTWKQADQIATTLNVWPGYLWAGWEDGQFELQLEETGVSRPPLTPDDPRHGRASSYTNRRCRCELCRAAWADYNRDRAAYKRRHAHEKIKEKAAQ